MPLQFNVKPVAEKLQQRFKATDRQVALAGADGHIERTAGAARQRDNVRGLTFEPFQPEAWRLVRGRIKECTRVESHKAAIALRPSGEQNNAGALGLGIAVP